MADSLTTGFLLECSLVIDNELIECSNKCVEYLKKVDAERNKIYKDKISYNKYMLKIGKNSILSIKGIYKYETYNRDVDVPHNVFEIDYTPINAYKDCLLKRLKCKTMADQPVAPGGRS